MSTQSPIPNIGIIIKGLVWTKFALEWMGVRVGCKSVQQYSFSFYDVLFNVSCIMKTFMNLLKL